MNAKRTALVAWHTFCVGHDDALGNPGGYFQDSDNDETEKEVDVFPWKENLPATGYTPTVSLLLQMDQVMIRRVLQHLTHCATNEGFPIAGQRAAWLYALLARLERPIHRDDAVTLYSLLKKMTALREQIPFQDERDDQQQTNVQSPDRKSLATLNVLIAIVGMYFEQGGGYANVMEVKTA
jgi:gem associated protein 2